jgi:hypothetical protein
MAFLKSLWRGKIALIKVFWWYWVFVSILLYMPAVLFEAFNPRFKTFTGTPPSPLLLHGESS